MRKLAALTVLLVQLQVTIISQFCKFMSLEIRTVCQIRIIANGRVGKKNHFPLLIPTFKCYSLKFMSANP
jgi:hypothetical protein